MMLFHETNKVLWSALPWAMLIINAQMLQTYENLFVFICFSNLVYQEIISCWNACLDETSASGNGSFLVFLWILKETVHIPWERIAEDQNLAILLKSGRLKSLLLLRTCKSK